LFFSTNAAITVGPSCGGIDIIRLMAASSRIIALSPAQRPIPAYELDARRRADLLQLADEYRPDLGRVPYMRAATSTAIDSVDRHDAQRSGAFGCLAQAQIRGRVFKADVYGKSLGRNLPAALLELVYLFGGESRRVNVYRRSLATQMEADRTRPIQLLEHGRQQVLAGVLLHMIVAASPIDGACHFRFG
jgi:hypothetical protein